MSNIFFDIGIIIIVATAIGYLIRLLKQPLIPAYILAGILIGPFGLKLITDITTMKVLSEIGIAFLLFVVGLELELKKLNRVGLVVTLGGSFQVILSFFVAFVIGKLVNNFSSLESVYIGLILLFSSTMVVVKLLSDKKELNSLHGRIILGILLVQDVFAIVSISILSTLNNFSPLFLVYALIKALLLFLFTLFCSNILFPRMFKFAAKSQELLFLLSLSMCFFFSLLAYYLGFSIAIGAFIAGVALANLPYNFEIIARVKPLRDFFSTLFFVILGTELIFEEISHLLLPIFIFTIFVLILKPLIIFLICKIFNYARRTSFLTALNLSQISEFSLIIAAFGVNAGHISQEIFTLTILVAVLTITMTPYFIQYDHALYFLTLPFLKKIDKFGNNKRSLDYIPEEIKYDIILVGYDRVGYSVLNKIREMKKKIIVIDFNPEVIRILIDEKIPCLYGDIGDPELVSRIDLKHAKTVISTTPVVKDNLYLIKRVKSVNKKALIFVTAESVEEALKLYDKGADYVILPHLLGGHHVSLMLEDVTTDLSKLLTAKAKHIEELKHRRLLGHDKKRHKH